MVIRIQVLIALIVMLVSCSTNNKDRMTTEQDKFTWNVQFAGYNHNQANEKGETNYKEFINEFDSFPWLDQIEKATQFPEKSAPTISIKDLKSGKDFWISMSGDRNSHGYIIGYVYPKEKKRFLGFSKPKQIRWLEMRLTEDKQAVQELIKTFFDRRYNKFEFEIRKLEDFGQMESLDLHDID